LQFVQPDASYIGLIEKRFRNFLIRKGVAQADHPSQEKERKIRLSVFQPVNNYIGSKRGSFSSNKKGRGGSLETAPVVCMR
jgi:hypothetical protein